MRRPVERLVRLGEREQLGRGPDRHLGGERQELLGVAAGQVGDRADHALAPQDAVGEARDVAHVDAARDHHAALAHRLQRRRDQRADRGEDQRGVELRGRALVRAAGPDRAQLAGEVLRRDVVRRG